MIQEFKTYNATPGNIDALIRRFHVSVVPILSRLGITVEQAWTSADAPDTFYYMVSYPTMEAGKAAWAAFGSDTEWKATKAASEINGAMLASQSTLYLQASDFSSNSAQ
jgi:hypothetical protein